MSHENTESLPATNPPPAHGTAGATPPGAKNDAAARQGARPAPPYPVAQALAPLAASWIALGAHFWEWTEWLGVGTATPTGDSPAYAILLGAVFAIWLAFAGGAWFAAGLRAKVRHNGPLLTAGILTAVVWETVTARLGVLPMPYFPGPDRVFGVMLDEAPLLAESAWASLRLLAIGLGCGGVSGFLLGVWFGWSRRAAYWGMPVLKFLGPVPATAWIPFALMLFPTTQGASVFIVALASLFPMVVLTASGVAGTRHSHLEVARTLGAKPGQLILRVAIPSALPSIFTGLFMALSASFITLVVAEAIGAKAGLGWYINWAQNFAEYHKIHASLLLMAMFFSSLMAALFLVRDRVLRWQQGLIKW
ncbi:MAG: ABC transporter permease [Puniceicoccales bacterium]|jgi:NitT/TauT family transport system permease protein|nr:ABC transporter permease [Puniceicoccales bacterium]